ncbi:hypothetical protein E2C05_23560 [Paracraurococcus ruber]|uniref:Uncharacterized protein n=2 Tax=Paracraurococcus ruber TaxID=77675 RepID=A0ABS1D6N9_9PROT|nr:hypothetical protein [Paracraurococcus ruber]MBK1662558.1 hypothetical protein [Paracraurococcus ruber]TDG27240.1 hypothetical protein E2C05_23560 [Paracraurococcus ruber]
MAKAAGPGAADGGADQGGGGLGIAEAAILGIGTATLYMVSAAAQLGYQDQFGFTYLTANVEGIAATVQFFILPLVCGLILSGLLALATLRAGRLAAPGGFTRLAERLMLPLPLAFAAAFWLITESPSFQHVARNTLIVLAAYWGASPILVGAAMRLLQAPPAQFAMARRPLLWGQALLGCVLLIFFSYDFGKANALHTGEVDVCEPNDDEAEDWILVQQTLDVFVCARVDWETRQVFAEFLYMKLDEDRTIRVRRIAFTPAAIGVRR